MALFISLLSMSTGSVLFNFSKESCSQVLVVVDTVGFIQLGEISGLDSIHKELATRDEVELLVDENDDFDVFPVSEDGGSFLRRGTNVGQGVGEVMVATVVGLEDVTEVQVAVGDGQEETEVVGKDADGAFAL
jgi:hypothetical protein